ncbi:MAG: hypothetical protein ACRDBQ_18455 [Shewanella sp.]
MIGTVLYDLPTRVCEFGEHKIQEEVSIHIAKIVERLEVQNAFHLFRQYMFAYTYGSLSGSVENFIECLIDDWEEDLDPQDNQLALPNTDNVVGYRTMPYCTGNVEDVNRAIEIAAEIFNEEHRNGRTGLASVVGILFPGRPVRLSGDTYDTLVVSCIAG